MFGTLRFINWKLLFYIEYFTYNEKEKSFIFKIVLFFSLIFRLFCYLNIDPIKSCLFLILSLLSISSLLSFGTQIWFSYFVCIIFLRGIFVILVYFSSLSKYNFYKFKYFIFIFLGLIFCPLIYYYSNNVFLFNLYYFDYLFLLIWIIISLIFFINFTSYFLNFSGALRKI